MKTERTDDSQDAMETEQEGQGSMNTPSNSDCLSVCHGLEGCGDGPKVATHFVSTSMFHWPRLNQAMNSPQLKEQELLNSTEMCLSLQGQENSNKIATLISFSEKLNDPEFFNGAVDNLDPSENQQEFEEKPKDEKSSGDENSNTFYSDTLSGQNNLNIEKMKIDQELNLEDVPDHQNMDEIRESPESPDPLDSSDSPGRMIQREYSIYLSSVLEFG